jgi:hypothetical protein
MVVYELRNGWDVVLTDLTIDEAYVELQRYLELFPEGEWRIEQQEKTEYETPRHYNNNAVDGWEDMFNY